MPSYLSGRQNLNFVGKVDVGAKNGKNGKLLLDPTDIIVNPDDGNDATFDISNLQNMGDIELSAANSIIFNTDAFFEASNGTITLVAGGQINLRRFETGGRNLNVSGGFINGLGKIFSGSSYGQSSGNIKLTSLIGGIDLGQYTVVSNSISGNAGNISLTSNSFITTGLLDAGTFVDGNGGNVKLLANSNIFTSAIVTHSIGNGKSGNVSVESIYGSIYTTGYSPDTSTREIYVAGNGGNAGSVTLKAFGDIVTNSIRAISNNGIGGAVRLTSQKGKIDTNGEAILTFSNSANAGNVILKADLGVSTGEINAYVSGGGGKGGVIRIDAGQDIFTGLISASSQNGDGRNITITSINGSINTNGGAISSTSFAAGNAGTITLKSAKDIKVGDIFARSRDGEISSTGVWNGGAVNITASGNIETGSITTTSFTGDGGNIKIEAGGESIKVLNTLKQNHVDYSIISAGATKNGGITINRKSGSTGTFFAVGDATYNGTKGAIGAGKDANGVENSLLTTTIVTGTYADGNIRILTPDIPASSLSNPRTIPAETPTSTYSFTPVDANKVQNLINLGKYEQAIVALDNLRTIEFYQGQGNTMPTVPQLNSVNQIKNFLNAGDPATGSKSAMIYTFLSGATLNNPSGTSLNLFAVTSTSDIIYKTIPLFNGQYQGFTVSDTVIDFRSAVADSSLTEDYKDPASRLYDLIFKPLKDALSLSQVNNLIFSTDSLFRTIPLAALYDGQSSKFLVEDFSSSVTPSFQVIEKDRYRSLQGANVLKMGATVFGSSTPLPSVRTELENIAQIELQKSPSIRHSPVYLNNQFSSSNLKTLIAKNDAPIVHFSTHGVAPSNSESFILMGSNNSSGRSDILSASDIRQLKDLSNKDLLVFSTCVSFTGFDYGTAGAALVAGVKAVIGCRWIVNDSGTMVAMTGFYQKLLGNGLSKTKSLQEAQKSMILGKVKATDVTGTTDKAELSIDGNKVVSSEYGQQNIKSSVSSAIDPNLNYLKHPYYWSAFSLIGNPW